MSDDLEKYLYLGIPGAGHTYSGISNRFGNSEILDLFQHDKDKNHSRVHQDMERKVYLDRLEREYLNLTERQKKIIEKDNFTLQKLQLLEECLKQDFKEQEINDVINPEFDFWQMQLVAVGFGYGLTMEEIEPAINVETSFASFSEREGLIYEAAHIQTVVKDVKQTVVTQKPKKENIR